MQKILLTSEIFSRKTVFNRSFFLLMAIPKAGFSSQATRLSDRLLMLLTLKVTISNIQIL